MPIIFNFETSRFFSTSDTLKKINKTLHFSTIASTINNRSSIIHRVQPRRLQLLKQSLRSAGFALTCACRTLARRPAAFTAYYHLSSTCFRWHLACHHGCWFAEILQKPVMSVSLEPVLHCNSALVFSICTISQYNDKIAFVQGVFRKKSYSSR